MDSRQIEERAAAWLAKRDSGEWTAEDERELAEWLAESACNEVAFIRLEAVWDQTLRLKALGAGKRPGTVPPPNAWRLSPYPVEASQSKSLAAPGIGTPGAQRRRSGLLAAAAVFLVVIVSGIVWHVRSQGPIYRTAIGGIATVPMSDGSSVTLNTDSAIRVAVTEVQREVELDRGEAFFQVAADPKRPFVVNVGKKRVVAVGTKFSVRRIDEGDMRVVVTEGKVRVEDASALVTLRLIPPRESPSNSAQPTAARPMEGEIFLNAGTVARSIDEGLLVQRRDLAEAEEYVGWRTGFLTFREIPLRDAVAEFNRYNERKITIADPSVAAMPISGKFRATNFEAFVRLLEDGFPVRARHTTEGIVLTDRAKT